MLPYGKATSHLHDTWLNVDPSRSNVGTMPSAWAISTLAGPGTYLRGWEQNPMIWHLIANKPRIIEMTRVLVFLLLACFGSFSCSFPMVKMESKFENSVAKTVGRSFNELRNSKTQAFIGKREPIEIKNLESGNLLYVYDYWKGTAMKRDGTCRVYLEFDCKTMLVLKASSEGKGCYTAY